MAWVTYDGTTTHGAMPAEAINDLIEGRAKLARVYQAADRFSQPSGGWRLTEGLTGRWSSAPRDVTEEFPRPVGGRRQRPQ